MRPGSLFGCGLFLTVLSCGGASGSAALGITFSGSDPIKARGAECLMRIRGFGKPGTDLLDKLAAVPVRVTEEPGPSSATAPTKKGEAQSISWSLQDGTYGCSGAPKVPCAVLLHELVHAGEYFDGTASQYPLPEARDEWDAVRLENWLLSKLGLCQRTCYDRPDSGDVLIPMEAQVTWPVAAGSREVSVQAGGMLLCAVLPEQVTLTVENQTPELILVAGMAPGDNLLCGGQNPYFRARDSARKCTLVIPTQPDRNPFDVPLNTLVAYYPSGDPKFPPGGKVIWTGDGGGPEPCGGNAFSEYCQIAMGDRGSSQPPLKLARPRDRTVTVKYQPPQR